MSSTGVATGAEAVTSSHIEEVTEELTQPRVFEVPTTSTILKGTTIMIGKPHLRQLTEGSTIFGFSAWYKNKHSLYTPTLIVIAKMVFIIA